MPYRCEKCARPWDDRGALENELICTRRCGGRLLPEPTPLPADDSPRKVYIELTTDCNMDCAMCIRHSWDEPAGTMSPETFDAVLAQLKELRGGGERMMLNFSGFGEPMSHPRFFDLLARAKAGGFAVEVVTNGTLLDADAIERLIDLELDRIVVSLDGVGPGAAESLHAGSFPDVSARLRALHERRMMRKAAQPETHLMFVATRRNIHELPQLRQMAVVLGFSSILVTNLVPHTPELSDQILYEQCNTACRPRKGSRYHPLVDLPVMDAGSAATDAVERLRGGGAHVRVNGADIAGASPRCRFVTEGRLAVGADGNVSPCLPLMHSHTYYFRGQPKQVLAYHVGNVNETPLPAIWAGAEYVAFRDRVREFAFSPCIDCGRCDLRQTNREDCSGDVFPRCGECLWAAGLVQCP